MGKNASLSNLTSQVHSLPLTVMFLGEPVIPALMSTNPVS